MGPHSCRDLAAPFRTAPRARSSGSQQPLAPVTKVLLRRLPLARQPLRVGDLDRPEKTVMSLARSEKREQERRVPGLLAEKRQKDRR